MQVKESKLPVTAFTLDIPDALLCRHILSVVSQTCLKEISRCVDCVCIFVVDVVVGKQ